MKLHIFNPEHDIALAYNQRYLMVPHAAKELRMNLGFIPSLWADSGDCVLVDDVPFAIKASSALGIGKADILFVEVSQLASLSFDEVCPWGWDRRLRTQLLDAGVDSNLLPCDDVLDDIRFLSGRQQTKAALTSIRQGIEDKTCGKSYWCTSMDSIKNVAGRFGNVVFKAPWSSSGRGIRYVTGGTLSVSTAGWARNIIATQGGVMAEPYYNKVKDFGMEFYSKGDGNVEYCGLSLFDTQNGAYTGNIISSENNKLDMLSRFVSEELIDVIKQRCLGYFGSQFRYKYKGAFGIDMMIVAADDKNGFLIHPCVEVNLRNTMGHLAISLALLLPDGTHLMRIVRNINYALKITSIDEYFVKTF